MVRAGGSCGVRVLRSMLLLLLLACSGADVDSDPSDTAPDTVGVVVDSTDTDTDVDPCADAPAVTYNNFGRGFVTESCQGCHASTAPNRFGAPVEVVFDTVEDCWKRAERILARSASDTPTMPPQGGVFPDDRARLRWWLTCAPSGT